METKFMIWREVPGAAKEYLCAPSPAAWRARTCGTDACRLFDEFESAYALLPKLPRRRFCVAFGIDAALIERGAIVCARAVFARGYRQLTGGEYGAYAAMRCDGLPPFCAALDSDPHGART